MIMKRAASCFGKADMPRSDRPLRDLPRAFGHSQALTAALAGLAENTVGAVDPGRSNPRLPTIIASLGVIVYQIVAALAALQGRVAITRAGKPQGDLSLGPAEPALQASALSVLQGQWHSPQSGAATMLVVRDGVVMVTTASKERLRLGAGDTCYAGDGAISFAAGPGVELARLACVAYPRRRLERE